MNKPKGVTMDQELQEYLNVIGETVTRTLIDYMDKKSKDFDVHEKFNSNLNKVKNTLDINKQRIVKEVTEKCREQGIVLPLTIGE